MNALHARYYDGISAVSRDVVVRLDEGGEFLSLESSDGWGDHIPLTSVKVLPKLGRTPRQIEIGSGRILEMPHDVDLAGFPESSSRSGRLHRVVDSLERHRAAVLLSVIGIAVTLVVFIQFGIPLMAESLAAKTPRQVLKTVEEQSLSVLDRVLLKPSELPAADQDRIRDRFSELVGRAGETEPYRVEFRKTGLGANAFALPNGLLVLTDDLVELAETDDELCAVLAHELGHVVHRHGMRLVYQKSGLVLLVSFFLGDVSALVNAAGALPLVLVESGYSRQFESEADDYAARFCLRAGIGAQPLVSIFGRLREAHGDDESLVWLSSHPDTGARIEAVQAVAEETEP